MFGRSLVVVVGGGGLSRGLSDIKAELGSIYTRLYSHPTPIPSFAAAGFS